jgi:hypothetical protein
MWEGIVILMTNRSKKDSFFDPIPLPLFDHFVVIAHPLSIHSVNAYGET